MDYGDCCYDYEVSLDTGTYNGSSLATNLTMNNFTDGTIQNVSWSNYLTLIETLDNVISPEQMYLVYNRSPTTSGYDCITPSLTISTSYYLISK